MNKLFQLKNGVWHTTGTLIVSGTEDGNKMCIKAYSDDQTKDVSPWVTVVTAHNACVLVKVAVIKTNFLAQ